MKRTPRQTPQLVPPRSLAYGLRLMIVLPGAMGLLLSASPVHAQLSPGALSKAHEDLEGLTNCTSCHDLGSRDNRAKCLTCHTAVGARLEVNRGYHAYVFNRGVRNNCGECHSDHNGRDFELIHWPEGESKFNHELTGLALHGRHAELECRACHKPSRIAEDLKSLEPDINLDRTMLGLSKKCLGCHADEHRQQLSPTCATCHTDHAWKPATLFNHDATVFPLTGKHKSAKCASCHPPLRDDTGPDTLFSQFIGLKYDQCADCHEDKHKDHFGQNCRRCHNTGGWNQIAKGQVDHNRTDFPLRGKHVDLSCDKCHVPGNVLAAVKHAMCTDCHTDQHRGQFANRDDKGACESCHHVQGFKPALFTIAAHQNTKFPLDGAHLAQPCMICHKSTLRDVDGTYRRFAYKDRNCLTCHEDRHGTQFRDTKPVYTCIDCHTSEEWAAPDFDHHKRAGYALKGAHQQVPCAKCHKSTQVSGRLVTQYRGISRHCESCHGGVRPTGDVGESG